MRVLAATVLVVLLAAQGFADEESERVRKELEEMKRSQAELLDMLRKQGERMAALEARLAGPQPTAAPKEGEKPDEPVKWNEMVAGSSKIKFYGFIRADLQYDDSRPNNTQTIAFIRSEDPTAPGSIGAPNDTDDMTIHPRLTRFGFDLDGPLVSALGDAKVKGKIEVDFYNNGLVGQSESRQALRMRHAYLTLGWTDLTLLAGQTSDIISPFWPIVNSDLVMWGAGNLGDRRPQFRLTWDPSLGPGELVIGSEIGLSGADDNQDIDPAGSTGAGYRDGETSGLPTFQERVAYRFPLWKEKKQSLEFGLWAHHAWEETDAKFQGDDEFQSSAYGADLMVPIYEDLFWFKGEIWTGKNIDDIRGGIFQGINTVLGKEIDSEGGFGEFGFKACKWYSISAGYLHDNPDDSDLNGGGKTKNEIYYLANRFSFDPIEIGADYLSWTTDYKGFDEGDDNRFNIYIMYKF